jgi:hypothetical protein
MKRPYSRWPKAETLERATRLLGTLAAALVALLQLIDRLSKFFR